MKYKRAIAFILIVLAGQLLAWYLATAGGHAFGTQCFGNVATGMLATSLLVGLIVVLFWPD